MQQGFFIVLDGPDGSGTTLHSTLLTEKLKGEGHSALLTAEPSEGPIGRFIREHLKSGVCADSPLPTSSVQLLFTADRAWHIKEIITPALKEGKVIVCDRYIHSTLIYGSILGEPMDWLLELNKNFVHPDVIIFALPPIEICLERIARRSEKDIFEEEATVKKVHAMYRSIAECDRRIHTIDTSGAKEEVAEEIWRVVNKDCPIGLNREGA